MVIVWDPEYPVLVGIQLFCGAAMIIAATVVICKVRMTTKNTFAYTLLTFTVLFGVSLIGRGLSQSILKETTLPFRVN